MTIMAGYILCRFRSWFFVYGYFHVNVATQIGYCRQAVSTAIRSCRTFKVAYIIT